MTEDYIIMIIPNPAEVNTAIFFRFRLSLTKLTDEY